MQDGFFHSVARRKYNKEEWGKYPHFAAKSCFKDMDYFGICFVFINHH